MATVKKKSIASRNSTGFNRRPINRNPPKKSHLIIFRQRPRSSVVQEIDKMKLKRDERRIENEEIKSAITEQQAHNIAQGKNNTEFVFENLILL